MLDTIKSNNYGLHYRDRSSTNLKARIYNRKGNLNFNSERDIMQKQIFMLYSLIGHNYKRKILAAAQIYKNIDRALNNKIESGNVGKLYAFEYSLSKFKN